MDASGDKGAPNEEKPPAEEGDDAAVPADLDVSTDKAQVSVNGSGTNGNKKSLDSGDDSAPG